GVAQVLRLRRSLRPPADHADLLDTLEGPGQPLEQVSTPAHDRLAAVAHGDVLLVEDGRLEVQGLVAHLSLSMIRAAGSGGPARTGAAPVTRRSAGGPPPPGRATRRRRPRGSTPSPRRSRTAARTSRCAGRGSRRRSRAAARPP